MLIQRYEYIIIHHSISTRLLRLLKRRLEWTLSLWCKPGKMATLSILPVHQCRMDSNSVIPHDDGILLPFDTRLEVCALGHVVVEEIQDGVGLFLLVANDAAGDLDKVSYVGRGDS
jgi:hypothetical protein